MIQEDKELLLKDLCARLPYGVVIEYNNDGCSATRELGLGSLHDFMFDNITNVIVNEKCYRWLKNRIVITSDYNP